MVEARDAEVLEPPVARVLEHQKVRSLALPGALFGIIAAVHFFSLLRTPAPFVDEGNFASEAVGLLRTGWAFGPVQSGVLNNFDGYWTYFPWLGTWFESLGFRAFGVSFFSIRLVSLVFGMFLLAAVYLIALRLRGKKVALLSVASTATSASFFYSAHLGRQDIIVAAFGFGAIAIYLDDAGAGPPFKSLLSGLLVGLAFEIHPNAMIYGPVVVFLYFIDYGWSTLHLRKFWGFAAGCLLGLGFWAGIHLFSYPSTFVAITHLAFESSKVPPILRPDPSLWLQSIADTLSMVMRASDLRLGAVVISVAILARKGTRGDWKLILLFGVLCLEFVCLVPYKPRYYQILLSPAGDLVLAAGLVTMAEMRSRSLLRRVALLSSVVIVLVSTAFNVSSITSQPFASFDTTVQEVRQTIPTGSVIMGDQTMWIGLRDYRFYTWQELTFYRRYASGSSLDDAFRAYHPDYFIVDFYERYSLSDTGNDFEEWKQLLFLPRQALEKFLSERGEIVADFPSQVVGRVIVYRLNWTSAESQVRRPDDGNSTR